MLSVPFTDEGRTMVVVYGWLGQPIVEGLKTTLPPPGMLLPAAPLAPGEPFELFIARIAPATIATMTTPPTSSMTGLIPDRAGAASGAAGGVPQACGWS